jgi:wyosine [tRNA(Phe)-imidazoG37] synthetase (radical SAM superfamily)
MWGKDAQEIGEGMSDKGNTPQYVFGPVPSRRLGRSLGVDLVPYKTCTFDCIYCDLGRTTHKTVSRGFLVSPEEIQKELELTLPTLGKKPDYITLSGSGEPTLNQNMGDIIRSIKKVTSIPLAVLTNGSLLFIEAVRRDLMEADVVLPSLDAVSPLTFECVNRPHDSLKINEIISGLIQFRHQYRGQIWLEVVFCRGVNDDKSDIERLKETIEKIQPDRIQLNTAARPPAEEFAYPLTLDQLEEIRKKLGEKAEIISEFAADLGAELDSVKDTEIVNLIKRRPCTTEDISKALGLRIDEVAKHLAYLSRTGAIRYRMYQHHCYYYEVGTVH